MIHSPFHFLRMSVSDRVEGGLILTALLIGYVLGKLQKLRSLWLYGNQLNGNIPESLGDLSNLISLDISYNNSLSGSIPLNFVNLTKLWEFYFSETDLCEPSTPEFLAWKHTVTVWIGTDITCP
jgi:Leucine-rich repeat (LRR) protein